MHIALKLENDVEYCENHYLDTGWDRKRRDMSGPGQPRARLLLPEPEQS